MLQAQDLTVKVLKTGISWSGFTLIPLGNTYVSHKGSPHFSQKLTGMYLVYQTYGGIKPGITLHKTSVFCTENTTLHLNETAKNKPDIL